MVKVHSMLKSTLFASFLLFAASSVCNAQQIDSLVVSNGSGDKAFLLDDVRRIDFSSDGMTVVSRTSNDQVFAFSDINKVFFGGSTTDIRSVSGKVNPSLLLRLTNQGNLLHVDGWVKSKSIQAEIYQANGTEVKFLKQWNGEDIDISSLPHGVYIIKLGSQAAKFNK